MIRKNIVYQKGRVVIFEDTLFLSKFSKYHKKYQSHKKNNIFHLPLANIFGYKKLKSFEK